MVFMCASFDVRDEQRARSGEKWVVCKTKMLDESRVRSVSNVRNTEDTPKTFVCTAVVLPRLLTACMCVCCEN